jgi:hypothetical protein
MTDIQTKIRDLSDKWKNANMEASTICRDAAEELRVLRLQLQAANRELEIYRSMTKSKFYPNIPENGYKVTCSSNVPGWGKGKDE